MRSIQISVPRPSAFRLGGVRLGAIKLLALLGTASLLTATSWAPTSWAADPANPTWSKDVLPILRANCYACHQTSKTQGGYLMTKFDGLLKG
ncbi:MAG: hypothetical protein WCP62_14625, partial [Planctomycetota bacterium]